VHEDVPRRWHALPISGIGCEPGPGAHSCPSGRPRRPAGEGGESVRGRLLDAAGTGPVVEPAPAWPVADFLDLTA
ncbi:hypothetical protein, partial [Streptomyces shenzhenensis]|uniref:hypothetical protein n=1 Tax=Streptomyces shenzhenensis TaxID=943815 RepID=UPI00368C75B3